MHIPLNPTPVSVVSEPLERLSADWLVVPWYQGEKVERLLAIDAATSAQTLSARTSGEWTGKRFDLLAAPVVDGRWAARKIVLLGGGPVGEASPTVVRRLASAAAIDARDRRVGRLTFLLEIPAEAPSPAPLADWVQAAVEGLTLAEFDAGTHKSPGDEPARQPLELTIALAEAAGAGAGVDAAARKGRQLAHCANLSRELVNEPANDLPPEVLAARALELASGTRLEVEVLDEGAIAAHGLRLIEAVGQGSRRPPRLIVMTHQPTRAGADRVLGLVGKGVTFDSGGLSIKSWQGMERMKDDMAGGATVIAAMRALSLLDVPIRVVGVVPAAENMPGGGALRPGDVVRGASGRSVEVVNTDAEGRLLLADGLWFARQRGATHLVDIATLTGACMVALGRFTAGVFGRPDDWRDRVLEMTRRCGEPSWALPLVDDERDQLDSAIADTTNAGSRYGGAITAALFIGEFAGGLPWVHIDEAGPFWITEKRRDFAKGPTGFGLRTLVALAESLSEAG